MSKASPSFYEFLQQQVKREDPVGDFARDAVADKDRPRGGGLVDWRHHLQDRDPLVLQTLSRVWGDYANHCKQLIANRQIKRT